MTNREEFLNKISGNDDNISIEEYMPIMKMILSASVHSLLGRLDVILRLLLSLILRCILILL